MVGRILITGGSGFVGTHLVHCLSALGIPLTLATRENVTSKIKDARTVAVGTISGSTRWNEALADCRTIIHLAAQTPGPGVAAEQLEEVNDHGTRALAEQAASAGVPLFIFASSIFAVVDNAVANVVNDSTPIHITTAYGHSKQAAERHVASFSTHGGVGISLRPPMVYGRDARGNWRLLQRLALSGLPLPFGAIHNQRSFIAVENLVDALKTTALAPSSTLKSGAYAVADEGTASLSSVVRWLREGMDKPPRLLPVPPSIIERMLSFAGKRQIAQSLLGNLVVDGNRFREDFNWSPPVELREGIIRSGADFVSLPRA